MWQWRGVQAGRIGRVFVPLETVQLGIELHVECVI